MYRSKQDTVQIRTSHAQRRAWDRVRAWWYIAAPEQGAAELLEYIAVTSMARIRKRAILRRGNNGQVDMEALYREALAVVQAAKRPSKRKPRPIDVKSIELSGRAPIVDDERF